MERVASRIVSRMILANLITDGESDEYIYEIQVLLEKIISYAVLFVLAIVFKRVLEIVLFTVSFSFLRKFSGGIHCQNFETCLLASLIVAFSSISVFSLLKDIYLLYQGGAIMSIIIVAIIGSVNNPNIDWNNCEYRRVKRVARLILLTETVVLLLLMVLNAPIRIRFFISYGIVMCAVSMLLEIRKKGGIAHEEGGKAALKGS